MTAFAIVPSLILVAACGAGKARAPQEEAVAETRVPAQRTEKPAAEPSAGEISQHRFASRALGVTKAYWLYLPSGYAASSKRYPVIYMLHGLGGDESNWSRHMGLTSAADAMGLQAIVVMPDGDDSFYVNSTTLPDYEGCLQSQRPFGKAASMASYCVKSAAYEDYIARDLIKHIDTSYRTLATRSARAIGGLSMGGYGALVMAMKHKDLYSSVASHSGVAALLYAGPFPYEVGKTQVVDDVGDLVKALGAFGEHLLVIYGQDIANWRAHDPVYLATELVDGELAIYIDCGLEDEFRLQNGASYLHEVLDKAGVSHDFELLPGHHDVHFWRDRIDDSLAFHVAAFAENLPQAATH